MIRLAISFAITTIIGIASLALSIKFPPYTWLLGWFTGFIAMGIIIALTKDI